jgi:hypothetical protein
MRTVRRTSIFAAVVVVACVSNTAAWASSWTPGLAASSSGEAHGQPLPGAPSATATCSGIIGNIVINWTAVSPVTGYTLYQSSTSASGPYSVIKSGLTTTTYTQTGLLVGSYWFEVSATVGSNWVSPLSAPTQQRTITVILCT